MSEHEKIRVIDQIDALEERVRELEEALREDRSVCICGHPDDEHEDYDEEGACCTHEDCECLPVAVSVRDIVSGLRNRVNELEEALRPFALYEFDEKEHVRRPWIYRSDVERARRALEGGK